MLTPTVQDPPNQPGEVDAAAPAPSTKPPRGPRAVVLAAMAGVFVLALVLGTAFGGRMTRVAGEAWQSAFGQHEHAAGDGHYYTCGMHPWVILPQPGQCPICQMNLEPIDPAKFTGEVSLSPVVVQNIGVRVEPVGTGPLVKSIRTVGTVDYAEPLVKDVNTKISGWIEKLYVDQMGRAVNEGEPLFSLYSPELYAAQEEYLLAYRSQQAAGGAPGQSGINEQLLQSARTKLAYYDITPEQISALEKAGKPAKAMDVNSPHTGVVIAKHANEGMRVDPGMQVYRIADLSRVWVMATIYEYQLPYVKEGQTAVMSLPYVPGQTFEGKVVYVYPYLNEKLRSVKVRLEFDNSAGLLKPGMFANVELRNTLAQDRVLVPRSAIIDTGTRQVAFVSLGEGRFEPRVVQVGVETEAGVVEVRDGLKPGEMVVTSGQFLIDSEARIREALAKMIKGDLAADQTAVVAVVGQSELASLPAVTAEALGRVVDSYFAIGQTLAGDRAEGIASPARSLAGAMDAVLAAALPDRPHFWHEHDEAATVRGKALELATAASLEQARLQYADLSVALTKLLRATGVPRSYGKEVHQLHCPMFQDGQGGSTWLQPAGQVRNPFFGAKMLKCFDRREGLPITGAAGGGMAGPDAPATRPSTEPVAPAAAGPSTMAAIAQNALPRHRFEAGHDGPAGAR